MKRNSILLFLLLAAATVVVFAMNWGGLSSMYRDLGPVNFAIVAGGLLAMFFLFDGVRQAVQDRSGKPLLAPLVALAAIGAGVAFYWSRVSSLYAEVGGPTAFLILVATIALSLVASAIRNG